MTSVDNLARLPAIEELRELCQSLATLDAILCPEWEYRYFSFNATWAPGEMLSSMRNGEGDDWLILFSERGAIMKGFVVDSEMASGSPWPGVLDAVPEDFSSFMAEPAFATDQTTFCLWRRAAGGTWEAGPVDYPASKDPDGSAKLLRFLDGEPETYRQWGEEYFGNRLNPKAIEQVYRHDRLTEFLVRSLNPKARLRTVREDIEAIGYPL
ncbi:MAG: hypothetical protein AAF560_17675 [Acidobacteriota bacterium]